MVLGSEFTNDRYTFFEKHKNTFEDTDENKLEYTQIHEAYMFILDHMMESSLMDKFSKEEIDGFYSTFKDKIHVYKEVNSDVVETLWGFIDFSMFKKEILKYKVDVLKSQSEKPEDIVQTGSTSNSDKDESYFWDNIKLDLNDKSHGWVKKMDNPMKNGWSCVMHSRPIEGKQPCNRTDFVFENTSHTAFMKYIDHMMKNPEDQSHLKKMEILEEVGKVGDDHSSMIVHQVLKMPLMSERESLISWHLRKLEDDKWMSVACSIEREDYPIDPKMIRMDIFKASMFHTKDNNLHCTEFSTFDMKGYFPMRLMNMMMSSIVSAAFPKMKTKIDEF